MSSYTYEAKDTKTPLETYEWDNVWFEHTEIETPDRVMYIGPGAFCGCDSLERVVVPRGVNKIASTTFACCRKLTHAEFCVELPDTILDIATDAFARSENVVIKAPYGSYAIQYAKENSIKYEII